MGASQPFMLILYIIMFSTYTWTLQYFIARAKFYYQNWTYKHNIAFVMSMATSRQWKEKTWKTMGVRDTEARSAIIKIQTTALFVGYLAAVLSMGLTILIFRTQHWL